MFPLYYLNELNQIKRVTDANDILNNAKNIMDEMIIPTICILNKKGYKTVFSCSGHFTDDLNSVGLMKNDECYIAFDEDKETLLKFNLTLPTGFAVEEDDTPDRLYKTCIRKVYDPRYDRFVQILSTMKDLYIWALTLPPKNLNIDFND